MAPDMPQATPISHPTLISHPHGITAVDTDYIRPGLAAAHIIVHGGSAGADERRAAFVDVGTNHSVPRLLAALAALDIAREAVEYVFLTHVHLDHAGGRPSARRTAHGGSRAAHPGLHRGLW